MNGPKSWIDTLQRARLAAFVCRDAEGAPTITERTAEFISQMNTLITELDEQALLGQLAAVWPPALDEAPVVVSSRRAPHWRCVIDAADDGAYLALFVLEPSAAVATDGPFYTMVENFPDIVSRHDRQLRHVYVNHAVDRVITPLTRDDYIGKTHYEVGETQEFIDFFQGLHKQVFVTEEPVEREFDYPIPGGGVVNYLVRIVPEVDVDGEVRTVLSTNVDISEVKRLQHQLEMLSTTDPLTELLNRRSFCGRLDPELQRIACSAGALSMMLIDVDNLKAINDGYGHAVGDSVLAAVGRILADVTRPSDLAARLGGDEFCVAMPDTSLQDAQPIAELIRSRIAELGRTGGSPVEVSVSIGVGAASATDQCTADVIARVDRLMYQAKLAGKNHVVGLA